MSKHILDHTVSKAEGMRVSEFTRIERAGQPADATKALQRRVTDDPNPEKRTEEYLRIEHGKTA